MANLTQLCNMFQMDDLIFGCREIGETTDVTRLLLIDKKKLSSFFFLISILLCIELLPCCKGQQKILFTYVRLSVDSWAFKRFQFYWRLLPISGSGFFNAGISCRRYFYLISQTGCFKWLFIYSLYISQLYYINCFSVRNGENLIL